MDARSVLSFVVALALAGAAQPASVQKPPGKGQKSGSQAKPEPPPPLEPWTGKYADAKQHAKDRNVPILMHILLEGEEEMPRYIKDVLENADLLRKSAECLVILGNNGKHAKKSIDVVVEGEKQKREVCATFPMFTSCAQHLAAWDGLYRDYQQEDGLLHCPQTILLSPSGELLMRVDNGQPPVPAEVVAHIVASQQRFGPGLTPAQLEEVRRLLESGRSLSGAQSFVEAWKTYAAVLALTSRTVYAEEATKAQAAASEGLAQELERIDGLLVPGTAVAGYRELVGLARAAADTPMEKDLAARVTSAERNPAIREEIAAWKVEVEADELLTQVRDLFDQNQEKQAERVLRKLFGKRYAETPAAATARKLWPERVPEPKGG